MWLVDNRFHVEFASNSSDFVVKRGCDAKFMVFFVGKMVLQFPVGREDYNEPAS